LIQFGAEFLGAGRIEVTELIAKEAVRPVRHQVAVDMKVAVSAFVVREVGREARQHRGTHLAPGGVVHRHGDKPGFDTEPIEFGEELAEVVIEDWQRLKRRQVPVEGDGG